MTTPLNLLKSCHLHTAHLLTLPLALLGLWLFPSAPVFANDCSVNRYYVDQDATGSNNGEDWANANTDLQTALNDAFLCPAVTEIWVAEGLYTPGTLADDTFSIRPGLAVYGGFAGTESALGERDWVSHVTVLSGDVAGNDQVDANGVVTTTTHIVSPNAYHVVTMDGVATSIVASTRLDGFVVTAGEARTAFTVQRGGGLYCNGDGIGNECSPTIANVTFSGNVAGDSGGAMANIGANSGKSNPLLNNVLFVGNSAGGGGAMFNAGYSLGTSNPVLNDVTFVDNKSFGAGGAMFNNGTSVGTSSPVLNRVTFTNNSSIPGDGGAMFNSGSFEGTSSPQLNDVTFTGNSARNGGAMVNECEFLLGSTSSPVLNRVTFSGNTATQRGGAMYSFASGLNVTCNPTLLNVAFFNNFAAQNGSAMYFQGFSDTFFPVLINVTVAGHSGTALYSQIDAITNVSFPISNSIFYGNDGQILNMGSVVPLIGNSLIQDSGGSGGGWLLGAASDNGGNLDTNARFADGANGNLRLRSDSPAIDVGNNSAVPVTVTTDLAGAPRISDGNADSTPTVDMGAYEFVVHALNVVRSGNGSGVVNSAPAAINCGADCAETLYFGTVVTLTTTANSDSDFSGWSGACTGTGVCAVTLNASKLVTATFTLKQYNITIGATPGAGGTVSGGGTFDHGDNVSVSATANPGYLFVNWTEGGTAVSTNPNYSFTATTDRTLVANFVTFSIAASASVNTSQAQVGETITYTYRITNTGAVTFATISATQDQVGAVSALSGELAPNATRTAIVTYVVKQSDLPGPLVATLTVTATGSTDNAVTADATTTVAISAPTGLPPSGQPNQPRQPIYLPHLRRD